MRRTARSCIAAVLLAGCAYDPGMQGHHPAQAYHADLVACRQTGSREAHRRVMSFGMLFLTYPISLPIVRRIQVRQCLAGRGYAG
ncbi:MAG: hypothetical protein FWD12_11085 [Alphaproteobacteria bacterium]|nr:hypothetical protein [Alphaproteobacteria bacterium]